MAVKADDDLRLQVECMTNEQCYRRIAQLQVEVLELNRRNKELTKKLGWKSKFNNKENQYKDEDYATKMNRYYWIMKDIIVSAKRMKSENEIKRTQLLARRFLEGRY